nr:MAG TPA: hypothetical protein [Caudoviricetes sp.]
MASSIRFANTAEMPPPLSHFFTAVWLTPQISASLF